MAIHRKTFVMKKIISLLFVLFCLQTANASTPVHKDTLPLLSKEDYLLKSKRQRTGAVISLSGGILTGLLGTVMVIGGSTIFFVETIGSGISGEQPDNSARNVTNVGSGLLILGTAAIITSIVLFNQSAKNKKVAMSMTAQPIEQLQLNGVVRTFVPSVRLTIDL